ncbi:MAG: MATE family efflux transporter [Burkholderiales bacterium]|nr:MATE family efflux transporter [Burkholderiales bacterium]
MQSHDSFSHRFRHEAAALWQLAWPMLVGQLASVGMNVADVAMSGHASSFDLAAVSLGASIWSILIVTMMGVIMAVNPTVSHLVGAGERERIPHTVRQAMWMALGVGVAGLLMADAASLIFDHMQIEPAVRDVATRFLHVIALAMPAFALYRVLYGYSTSLNQTKPMMLIALLALALNVLLNWLLVFGHFGLPRLGGVGCAYASLGCVWFNLFALLAWMRIAKPYRDTWPFRRFEGPHWPEIATLLKIGLPIGVTYFAEASAFSLIALLVAPFGADQVAAHQIALNFSSLVFMLPLSLGIALITRIGHALGEGNTQVARFRAWVGVGLAFSFAILSASFIACFKYSIAAAYTEDLHVITLAVPLLMYAAIFQLSDATQVSTACAIRGYKVTRPPMVIHLMAFWGFCLPLGCVLGLAPSWAPIHPAQPMAAQGFWIALIVGLTIAAAGLTWFLDKLSRAHLRPRPAEV